MELGKLRNVDGAEQHHRQGAYTRYKGQHLSMNTIWIPFECHRIWRLASWYLRGVIREQHEVPILYETLNPLQEEKTIVDCTPRSCLHPDSPLPLSVQRGLSQKVDHIRPVHLMEVSAVCCIQPALSMTCLEESSIELPPQKCLLLIKQWLCTKIKFNAVMEMFVPLFQLGGELVCNHRSIDNSSCTSSP